MTPPVRAPGGRVARLVAALPVLWLVPALSVHAFGLAWPLWGAWLAGLLAGGTGAGVWILLRRARRRAASRWALRALLLLLALLLVQDGVRRAGPAPEAPEAGADLWQGVPGELRAGFGAAPFVLPAATPLGGWGQAPRRLRTPAWLGLGPVGRLSCGLLRPGPDGSGGRPLFRAGRPGGGVGARALVLRPAGGPPFVLVRLDLVVGDATLARDLLARLADLGVRPETLVLAATHTHSGPGGYCDRLLAEVVGLGWFRPAVRAALLEAAERAVRAAHAAAVPARLAVVEAPAADAAGAALLGRNRRAPAAADGVDPLVQGLRVDDAAGRPLGALLAAAVHPVLFRPAHDAFDPDLAGALEEALGGALGGVPVLFLNGATADVTPRRGAQAPEARARDLAARVAEALAPAFRAAPAHGVLRLSAARLPHDPGAAYALAALGDRSRLAARWRRPPWDPPDLLGWLGLPASALAWTAGFPEARVLVGPEGVAVGVDLREVVGGDPGHVGVWRLDGGPDGAALAALAWHPGEPTAALGAAWRAAFHAAGAPVLLHVAFANGALGYLTTPAQYAAGGYEAHATLYGPEAGLRVGRALQRAWESL